MTPEAIGIPAFIILTLGGTFMGFLLSGKLRLGREFEAMEKQMLFWQRMALRGTALSEKATSVAEQLISGRE